MRVRFEDLSLDTDTRQLQRGSQDIHLSTKAFDLLRLLIEARPRVVSKHQLHEALWPGIYVSEANLFTLMSEVRTAIGDGVRDSVFVRTVHGVGYAFSAEVVKLTSSRMEEAQRVSGFVVISGARRIALGGGENVLGRDTDVSVCLEVRSVDRGLLGTATGASLMSDGIEIFQSPESAAHMLTLGVRNGSPSDPPAAAAKRKTGRK